MALLALLYVAVNASSIRFKVVNYGGKFYIVFVSVVRATLLRLLLIGLYI